MTRQLISSDEAVQGTCQHTEPCSDCPWARQSLNGWLGRLTAREWLRVAHGENLVACHVIDNQQCAGLAIYRANVVKLVHDPDVLRLPADREKVFANPMQFTAHHEKTLK